MKIKNKLFLLFVLIFSISFSQNLTLEIYSNIGQENDIISGINYNKNFDTFEELKNEVDNTIKNLQKTGFLKASINQLAQYEVCFGNQFHIKKSGYNIKSTGFTIFGESSTVYLTDIPNDDGKTGIIAIIKLSGENNPKIISSAAGKVDYEKGEVILYTVNITSTIKPENIIEIEAVPESNDVVGLKDLYLSLDVSKSKINMLRDLISSGDEISGVDFTKNSFTSSYSNGSIVRN